MNKMNRSPKTLLVLAASRYQVPTIQAAKALGYRVITTDNVPTNPGHALADESFGVDTTDREAVLAIAQHAQITGIIAPCTDVAVPTAAFVANQLGLPGIPLTAAEIVCDKGRFRQFLKAHGYPTIPHYFLTADSPLPPDFAMQPWLLKPLRSSGCKGIFIVNSQADYDRFFPQTQVMGRSSTVLLEKFIVGHQGTCEGILQSGEIVLSVVLDRQTALPPYVTTTGHHYPSRLSATQQADLLRQLTQIWAQLGVTDGPFDCDFVATEDNIYILEISPRMGGNSIATLLQWAINFDIVKYSVQQACGELPTLPTCPVKQTAAIVLFGVALAGYLHYDQVAVQSLQQEPWVKLLSFDVPLGATVAPFSNGRNRIGEALVLGRDRAELEANVQRLKQRLRIKAYPTAISSEKVFPGL